MFIVSVGQRRETDHSDGYSIIHRLLLICTHVPYNLHPFSLFQVSKCIINIITFFIFINVALNVIHDVLQLSISMLLLLYTYINVVYVIISEHLRKRLLSIRILHLLMWVGNWFSCLESTGWNMWYVL